MTDAGGDVGAEARPCAGRLPDGRRRSAATRKSPSALADGPAGPGSSGARAGGTDANTPRARSLCRAPRGVWLSTRCARPSGLRPAGAPISQRLLQEHIRHSGPKLTADTGTDLAHLPTLEAIPELPWGCPSAPEESASRAAKQDTAASSHMAGTDRPGASKSASVSARRETWTSRRSRHLVAPWHTFPRRSIGAGRGNRTLISGLGSPHNSLYTMPAAHQSVGKITR